MLYTNNGDSITEEGAGLAEAAIAELKKLQSLVLKYQDDSQTFRHMEDLAGASTGADEDKIRAIRKLAAQKQLTAVENLLEIQAATDSEKILATKTLSAVDKALSEEEARKILGDLIETLSKQQYVEAEYVFGIYIALGEKDQAMEYLEKTGDGGHVLPNLLLMKYDPIYYDISIDPRFIAVIKNLGC